MEVDFDGEGTRTLGRGYVGRRGNESDLERMARITARMRDELR